MDNTPTSVQMTPRDSRFGWPLTIALALPALIVIGAWCAQSLLRFPLRSAGASATAVAFFLGSVAAVIPVALAIVRLSRNKDNRVVYNYTFLAIGVIALLPVLAAILALAFLG